MPVNISGSETGDGLGELTFASEVEFPVPSFPTDEVVETALRRWLQTTAPVTTNDSRIADNSREQHKNFLRLLCFVSCCSA